MSDGNVLTDGQPVSPITWQKLIKDFVADFLITGAAGLGAVNVAGLGDAITAPNIALIAVANAAIAAGYRIVLRWATS